MQKFSINNILWEFIYKLQIRTAVSMRYVNNIWKINVHAYIYPSFD